MKGSSNIPMQIFREVIERKSDEKMLDLPEIKQIEQKEPAKDFLRVTQDEINTYSLQGVMELGGELVAKAVEAKESKSTTFLTEMRSIMDRATKMRLFEVEFNECIKEWDGLLKTTVCSSVFLRSTYDEQYKKWLQQAKSSKSIQETRVKSKTETTILQNEAAAKAIKQDVEEYKKDATSNDKMRMLFSSFTATDIIDKAVWHAHQDCNNAIACMKVVHEALTKHNSWENREAMKMAIEDFNRAQASEWLPKLQSWRSVLAKVNQLGQYLLERIDQKRPVSRVVNISASTNNIAFPVIAIETKEQKHVRENATAQNIENKQQYSANYLSQLPHDLLYWVLLYLTPEDIMRFSLTAKFLLIHGSADLLWLPHLNADFITQKLKDNVQAKQLYLGNELARKPLVVSNDLINTQVATAIRDIKYLRSIEYSVDISIENAISMARSLPIDARISIYPELPLAIALAIAKALAPLGKLLISSDSPHTYLVQLAAALSPHRILEVPEDVPVNTMIEIARALRSDCVLSLDPATPQTVMELTILALLKHGGIFYLHPALSPSVMSNLPRVYNTKIMLPAQFGLDEAKEVVSASKSKTMQTYLHPNMSPETVFTLAERMGHYKKFYAYAMMSKRALAVARYIATTIVLADTALEKAVSAAKVCLKNFWLDAQVSEEIIAVISQVLRPGCILNLPEQMADDKIIAIISTLAVGCKLRLPNDFSKGMILATAKIMPEGRILCLPELIDLEIAIEAANLLPIGSGLELPKRYQGTYAKKIAESLRPGCILDMGSSLSEETAIAAAGALLPGCLVLVNPRLWWVMLYAARALSIHCALIFPVHTNWKEARDVIEDLKPQRGIVLPAEVPKNDAIAIAKILPAKCFVKLPWDMPTDVAVSIVQTLKNEHKIILDQKTSMETADEVAGALNPGCRLEHVCSTQSSVVKLTAKELASERIITLPMDLPEDKAVTVVRLLKPGNQLLLSSLTTSSQALALVAALPIWCGLIVTPTMSKTILVELAKALPPGCTIILPVDTAEDMAIEIAHNIPLAGDLKMAERMSENTKKAAQLAYEQRFTANRVAPESKENSQIQNQEKIVIGSPTTNSVAQNPYILLRQPATPNVGLMPSSGRIEGSGLEHLISSVFRYEK